MCRIFCKFDADKVDKTRKAGEAEGADPEKVELAKDNFALKNCGCRVGLFLEFSITDSSLISLGVYRVGII